MTFVSYAQNYEDVILWRALAGVEHGFYIDVGAADPEEWSVTKAFYDLGWRGLDVEPEPAHAERLRRARPRDLVRELALGDHRGTAILHRIPGSGLSTLNADYARRHAEAGFASEAIEVEASTLAELCADAPADIHFLKIDVEGAEAAVLRGADFARHRPWIVLVEATEPMSRVGSHEAWEPMLLDAGYVFVLFDGLNRFYVASEKAGQLGQAFETPPNVFDDFVRRSEAAARAALETGETRMANLRRDLATAHDLETAARADAEKAAAARVRTERALRAATAARDRAQREKQDVEARLATTARQLELVLASTSWTVTAPLRAAGYALRGKRLPAADAAAHRRLRLKRIADLGGNPLARALRVLSYVLGRRLRRPPLRALVGRIPGALDLVDRRDDFFVAVATGLKPAEKPVAPATSPVRRTAGPTVGAGDRRPTVHQFHSGSAVGDAVTNAMLLVQRELRRMGYASEIFVQHRDPALEDQLLELDDIPVGADYALILHHSMGHDVLERLLALPAPKILWYHNITPVEFLTGSPGYVAFAEKGRRQLAEMLPHMAASLADSEFNAMELRRYGYVEPAVCTMLFDTDSLLAAAQAAPVPDPAAPFTVLFVGRLVASKAQADLVDGFAAFARRFGKPARLVLVGRSDSDEYPAEIRRRAAAAGVADRVLLTGGVSDAELHRWYRAADAYVSMSHHEGFGVPLVEAMAHGVPVIAWPCGAVPHTLGGASIILADREPETVASEILALAERPEACEAVIARQRVVLDRFRLDQHLPTLVRALAAARTPAPQDPDRRALAETLHITFGGHVNGSYSLAAVNRGMALEAEARRPGLQRFLPWENGPVADLAGAPPTERAAIAELAARPPAKTEPKALVVQHYPLWVPPAETDEAPFALVAWEESLLPAPTVATLNANFRGVLTPSRFVAKALIDSGVRTLVRPVGHALQLDGLKAVAELRPVERPAGRRFTFLHVSSCFPRKGVDVLLEAYARTFRGDEPVRLVIKSFPNPHNDVEAQIEALRRARPDIAAIEVICEDLDAKGMEAIYAEADAVVLPTRGEGFNMPAAEAMAAGVPLIVTGFGGHLDFCGPGEARLVDYRFARSSSHVAKAGSLWVEPDLADLSAALREVFGDRAPTGPTARRVVRARRAVDHLLRPERCPERVVEAVVDGLTQREQPVRLAWVSSWDVKCGIAEYSKFLLDGMDLERATDWPAPVMLCDDRTAAGAGVAPCWRVGDDFADGLARAVSTADPDAVVVQHQPGLLDWSPLSRFLLDRRVRGRVALVTLHAVRDLFRIDADRQEEAVVALAAATRILVHNLDDVNLLKGLGLVDNVTLFPHGVQPRAAAAAARALQAGDAPLIGSFGFFLPGKGLPRLVEAFARLRTSWPGARLRLCNAELASEVSSAEIARCRALAEELGVTRAIEWDTAFHPVQQSLARLAECDLLVFAYDESDESASGAVRIGLAAGPPVATTPVRIFEELGDAVLRLDSLDAAGVATGLSALLADQARRRSVQAAAGDWLSEVSWSALGVRMRGMMEGLVANRSAGEAAGPVRRSGDRHA